MNLGFVKFIAFFYINRILKILYVSGNLYLITMCVHTVVRWVLSSCSFGYQYFRVTLHFDQEMTYFTETSVVHLQDFSPENTEDNKQKYHFSWKFAYAVH